MSSALLQAFYEFNFHLKLINLTCLQIIFQNSIGVDCFTCFTSLITLCLDEVKNRSTCTHHMYIYIYIYILKKKKKTSQSNATNNLLIYPPDVLIWCFVKTKLSYFTSSMELLRIVKYSNCLISLSLSLSLCDMCVCICMHV